MADIPMKSHAAPAPRPSAPAVDPLQQPDAASITAREACNMVGMTLAVIQGPAFHADDKATVAVCNPVKLADGCSDFMSLSPGASQFLSSEETHSLHRKLPGILNNLYGCLRKMNNARLNAAIRGKELLLKRKKDLVEAGCDAIGALATADENSSSMHADFENPCGAMMKLPGMKDSAKSRTSACFSSASDVCKTLSGKVELENLIPPGMYEASYARNIPLDLPPYLQATMDGAIDVLKGKAADKANDLVKDIVSRKIVTKGSGGGAIALAAITSSVKQIHQALEHGDNAWAHCLGTDNLGACLHKFIAGGIPESKALARPKVVAGQSQIDCCYCQQDFFRTDGLLRAQGLGALSDSLLGTEDYLSPIEENRLEQTYCYQQQGEIREQHLVQSKGFNVYFRLRECQRVTITGSSCILEKRTKKSPLVVVLKHEKPFENEPRNTGGTRMNAKGRDDGKPKVLYAAGDRPRAPKPPGEHRFDELYSLPKDLAPQPYRWEKPKAGDLARMVLPPQPARVQSNAKPLDAQAIDRMVSLPPTTRHDVDLRKQVHRPELKASSVPTRPALPPLALPTPSHTQANIPLAALEPRNASLQSEALPPITPAPMHADELPKVDAPRKAEPAKLSLPDPDLRKHARPKGQNRATPPERRALEPLKLESKAPQIDLPKFTSPELAHRAAPEIEIPLPPLQPAEDKTFPPTETTASPCSCGSEWSQPRDGWMWQMCVVRKDHNWVSWMYLDPRDPGCRSSCVAMLSGGYTAQACKPVTTRVVAPTPPAKPAAKAEPVRPSPQALVPNTPAANRCMCRQEWTDARYGQQSLVCVIRRDGVRFLWTPSDPYRDPGCRNTCSWLWSDSRTRGCY